MDDVFDMLRGLRRPALLTRAARVGAEHYRRGTHLRRALNGEPPRATTAILARLIEIEAELNLQRKNGDATYSAARHIDVLIAIRAETQEQRAAA